MKTTVDIPDALFRHAKTVAAEKGHLFAGIYIGGLGGLDKLPATAPQPPPAHPRPL